MQHPEGSPQGEPYAFRGSAVVFILYLDEFGHEGPWDPNGKTNGRHPLFGLAGFAIPADRARDFDRAYYRLKLQAFRYEIERARNDGKRPERFEWKELRNRRDTRFTANVIQLIRDNDGHLMARGVVKQHASDARHSIERLYGGVAQGTLNAFEVYLRARAGKQHGCGIIVMDRRNEDSDVSLLAWTQSHLYSGGIGFRRIVETPMLVRSEWHHGVQAADTIARAIGLVWRARLVGDARHEAIVQKLGPMIIDATYTNERWSSVYVRADAPTPARVSQVHSKAPLSNPVITPESLARIKASHG
ncbi:MAG: DUF3800 domain-containing protein [Deltaproteobacteria bacterium]|nr:DUF3800 domain-containing protein [Deltaproteobacteria bacterium]